MGIVPAGLLPVCEVLAALAEFCRWAEANHAHPLWHDFGADLEQLSG